MTTPKHDTQTHRQAAIDAARHEARSAIERLALAADAQILTRPAWPGSDITVKDVDPLAGLYAAHEVEVGARSVGRDYVRYAREAGHTWHEIGVAMNLSPSSGIAGESIGEAAFTYATGRSDTEMASRYSGSVAWTCKSCDQLISDQGPCSGPAEDERGHADNCMRLAATIRKWDAEWEAGE